MDSGQSLRDSRPLSWKAAESSMEILDRRSREGWAEAEGPRHPTDLCLTHHPHHSLLPCMSRVTGLPNQPPRAAAHFHRSTVSPPPLYFTSGNRAACVPLRHRPCGGGGLLAPTVPDTHRGHVLERCADFRAAHGERTVVAAESRELMEHTYGQERFKSTSTGPPESERLVS